MNKDLNDLLIIDQEIGDFFYENEGLSDNELNDSFDKKHFVDKALKKVAKLSSKNVLEAIKRSRYLNQFIDLKKFIKKYPLNKSYLKKNKELYLDEYMKLKKTCLLLSDIAIDYKEFREYMDILDVDNIEYYLLENMSNKQIYTLSNETHDWMQKLYYFSFLKEEH